MPRYEFLCEMCNESFERTMTIADHDKVRVTCPKCQGTNVTPQFSGFVVQTSKKS